MDPEEGESSDGLVSRHRPKHPAVDLVVLHGFNSSIERAFTHANGKNWACDPSFWGHLAERIRLMTFAYNANAFHDVISARVIDHAEKLLEELYYARKDSKDRPLIFIAHSMGGLVVKRALLQAMQIDRYKGILQSTTATVFLATPHFGADRTGQVAMLQRLVAWSKLRSSNHVKNSQELATFSDTINDINRSFKPARIEIVNFYEQKETRLPSGSAMIVEPGSAILPFPNERHIPSPSTHESICRFDGPKDPKFVALWEQVDLIIDNALEASNQQDRDPTNKLTKSDPAEVELVVPKTIRPLSHEVPATTRKRPRAPPSIREMTWTHEPEDLQHLHQRTTFNLESDLRLEPVVDSSQALIDESALLGTLKEIRALQDKFLTRLTSWKSYRQKEEKLARHNGTCEWIFRHQVFKDWLHLEKPSWQTAILFLVGPSGCGKSVLANHIANTLANREDPAGLVKGGDPSSTVAEIEQRFLLKDEERATVLRFFCTDAHHRSGELTTDKEENSLDATRSSCPIIEAFLYQILDGNRRLFHGVPDITSRIREGLTTQDIEKIFRKVIAEQSLGHLILIIDGLDECDEAFNQDLIAFLDSLLRETPNNQQRSLRILISCQPVGSIPIWSRQFLSLAVKLENVQQDIKRYIEDEVTVIARTRNFTEELQGLAMNTLSENAGRSFLWTSFILRELRHMAVVSPAAVKSATTTFPRDLDRYYANFLAFLAQEAREIETRESNPGWVLLYVVFSTGDLRTRELAELLAIAEDRVNFEQLTAHVNTDVRTLVERRLSPLLVIENDLIVVAHSSINDYLERISSICLPLGNESVSLQNTSPRGHALMAELCLRYLLLHDFEDLACKAYLDWKALEAKFCLLRYTGWNLVSHLEMAGNDLDSLLPLLRKFFHDDSKSFRFWLRYMNPRNDHQLKDDVGPVLCQLVHFKLPYVIQRLTDMDCFLVSSTEKSFMPKFVNDVVTRCKWEIRRRSRDTKKGLFDLNKKDPWGCTPIHYAARSNVTPWLEAMALLEGDLFAKTALGETALHMSVEKPSDTACLKFLLAKGLPIDEMDCNLSSALVAAVRANNLNAVSTLLEAGASVVPDVRIHQLPLQVAVAKSHEEVALLLLKYQPRLYDTDSDKENLFHGAARAGMVRFAQVLIEVEPYYPIDARNRSGMRPLQLASMKGHTEFVEFLLQQNIDINTEINASLIYSVDEFAFRTPFHLALQENEVATAMVLLKAGGRYQSHESPSWYPTWYAINTGHSDMLRALHSNGQNHDHLEAIDSAGQSSLHWAAAAGRVSMLEWLLTQNLPVDPRDDWKETPMMVAILKGHTDVVDLLLRKGANLEAISIYGHSSLTLAAFCGYPRLIELLLPYRPKLEQRTSSGLTALDYAVRSQNANSVRLLLDAGAVSLSAPSGWSITFAAVQGGNMEILNLLLAAGANLDARSELGATPLMAAFIWGHFPIIDLLIVKGATVVDLRDNNGGGLYHFAVRGGLTALLDKAFSLDGGAAIDAYHIHTGTPFNDACERGDLNMIQWFVDKAVDINRVEPSREETGLHSVVRCNNLEAVNSLLNLGFSHSVPNRQQDTALDLSCKLGFADVTRLLINRGADYNRQHTVSGETCLHMSASSGNTDCVRILIQAGADIEAVDYRLQTPLFKSIFASRRHVTSLLVANGADVEACDSNGRSAYSLAQLLSYGVSATDKPRARKEINRERLLLHLRSNIGAIEIDFGDMQEIGELLMRLGDLPNARRAFIHRVVLPASNSPMAKDVSSDTKLRHNAHCDGCDSRRVIVGTRFKCLSCDDMDLCALCMSYYKGPIMRVVRRDDQQIITCEDHEYMEIPGTSEYYPMIVFEKEKYNRESSKWLQEVYEKYVQWESETKEFEPSRSQDKQAGSIYPWLFSRFMVPMLDIHMIWTWRGAPTKCLINVDCAMEERMDHLD